MLQPESRLCIILNIFFIARENVFGLKTDAVCSNYDLLQNKPMTSKIVNENEIKYYDFVNDDKHFTNNPEINANSIDPIRDDLNNYMNIETNDKAEIVGSAEDANDCLCGQIEYESSEPENLVESNKNDNLTYVYITGMDDSLVELKRNIQKYGKGHELIVNFYLYKNQKWYDLGYLYTDAYILHYFIPNYEKKFCVVNSKNNWCFDNLSKKHYLKDFNIETESSKFDKEVENFQPMVAESKNVCKLIEYVPTEVDGHYELNIPKEQQYTDENILDNYHQNNLRKQNTNLNNNISPQISLLETEDLGSSQTVINNNIDYPEEEHDANTVEVATGHKVCYKQDVNMLGEAIKNKYDMSSNVITYDDSNKESRIDRNSSMDTIKSNELTNDNEIFYKINENNLNYIPINTISDKESDCNYLTHPCSSEYSAKASNNDIVRTENNYELLKGIDSYDENNAARTELGYHLQYDDGTGTKGCDKCSKTNEAFRYNLAIPNMVSTPRYVGGIKTIVNPLSVVETPKLMFFPYQTHLIPNQQAKTNDMVSINDVPDSKIVYRNYNDNESILTRPQASVEQKIENVFKEYVPNYDLQSQVQSSPIPYEEATLTDNNIINDVQQPIKQDTYLNMPDIVNYDKRNYETLPYFNVNQNQIPWHTKYIPNETNSWRILPNIQKHLVPDSLNGPIEVNKDELLSNLQARLLIPKRLRPCTNNDDIRDNSKINFLVPQNEKEILYDNKIMFPNTDDTDKSEQEQLSLKDNTRKGLPGTKYYIQDPCTYKNLKSLVGNENGFLPGSYYTPATNNIISKQSVKNAYENILVPETNPVTTQDIQNPLNTLPQYKQNYKIPSRIQFTPLSYRTYPLKIVSSKPLTSNIFYNNPYLGSNIKNVNQPFAYNPALYKSVAYDSQQDKTPLIPKIIENMQSINRMNGICQKSPIQFSDNVDSNNFNVNPLVSQNQNLEDSMYSVDTANRNTACFTNLSENVKQIVDEVQSTKSITPDTSYVPVPIVVNLPNAEKSPKFNPKISILGDSLDPNIVGMPIKNSYAFTNIENEYTNKLEKTPFDENLQESTSAANLQPEQIPPYKLLKHRPNMESLSSYIDQTPQDYINSYNPNVRNTKRPAILQYTAYPTSSLQNILTSKQHKVIPTVYFQPTAAYSDIPLQSGHTSNLYHEKLENNLMSNRISDIFPMSFNSKTLSDRKRFKFLKHQNLNDFYNNNIQSRLQESQMYQQPLHKNFNYEANTASVPVKFSPNVGTVPGPTGFVEETNKVRKKEPNHQIINFNEIPLEPEVNDNGNYIINNPSDKIENFANTNPKYYMTNMNLGKNEIMSPDYPTKRQAPMSKFYDVCECKQNYFNIPFGSGNVPEPSRHEYMQNSGKPQELLNTEPDPSLTYSLPMAKLLPVKRSTINKGFVPVPTKVLLNTNVDNFQPTSTSTNREYSIIPNHKNFIPQLFFPSDRIFTETTAYQSNTIPVEDLEGTYFNNPYIYDNSKDTYKNYLQQPHKEILDGSYNTSPPEAKQEEIKSLRKENLIDYNIIENEGKGQMYSQPYMTISNYNKDIAQTAITPKIWSGNTILQKNSVIENNEPDGDKLTDPIIYNSGVTRITPNTRKYNSVLNKIFNVPRFTTTEPSLPSQVTTCKTNENGDITLKEIPEVNQGPDTFGTIRYSKPEYQINMPNNMYQGQDTRNISNNIPEIKQNYLKFSSNLDNLNFLRSFNPRNAERAKLLNMFKANTEPSSYLQHNRNPIYLTPYYSRVKKASSINNVVYPFTVKPSLSVQEAVNPIVTLNDPNTPSIPKVSENLKFGIDPRGPQRIRSLKQPSNLYYNPLDLRKSVHSVYDNGNPEPNNGYLSYSNGKLNPTSSSCYVPEKETFNPATTKDLYQYLNPTIMKINKHFNWPSKLEHYTSPVESYGAPKNDMHMSSDYTPINITPDSLTETSPTSELLNTPNYLLFGHHSGNTPLINTFDWNVNIQRKEPSDTCLYASYTKYPNTLTSLFGYKRPGVYYYPPIPLNAELNSPINNDFTYSNIPHKSPSISPNVADSISTNKNIFFNVHNVLPAFKKPIKQYKEYISDGAGQAYCLNDNNNEKVMPKIQQFPITPIVQYETYPKHNVLFSKIHDSSQTVNSMPGHVTYNVNSVPIQRSHSLYSDTDNPKYASLNLLYPKNIYSYSLSIPKESNQNVVNPLLCYKYLTKGPDNSSPSHMLHATTKTFSTVKTGEGISISNNLATQNSRSTEYNPLPQYAPWKRSLPLAEVNSNPIPDINSFIPTTQTNLSPITSATNPTVSSDRIFNKNDHVPQVVNSGYNMITQNIGAFRSNAIPMLLPSNVRQTNVESKPLIESIMSFNNEIPTIQPLLDFSSEIEPQRLISNKTSSEILKSNNDLVNPEQIYSERGKISFIPQIKPYCYDVKRNNFPIHSNEPNRPLNKINTDAYTIEDNDYSYLYPNQIRVETQKYEKLPSISQIEKQISNYNYNRIRNPFLRPQFADLNPFNVEKKPDVYNKFEEIMSSKIRNLPAFVTYIHPTASLKPPSLYSGSAPTYHQIPNSYTHSWSPIYENPFRVQNHNTLLNSAKTLPCTGSVHLLEPPVSKVLKSPTYPIITNEGTELFRSNLNTVYEPPSMITLPKSYLSSPISYTESNHPNPAMYQSTGNVIWNSDSGKYSVYSTCPVKYSFKQPNSLPDITSYDLPQNEPFNSALTPNIPLQQTWKQNVQRFIKSEIENFNKENPLTKTWNREEDNSNGPIPSQIDEVSNVVEAQNNINKYRKYYRAMPKIIIAKYEPSVHNSFVIKADNRDLMLKAWRSTLKVITPMLVYSVREVPTLNFMPIRNSKYAMGEDIEIARKYVAQKYGDPMVIRGVYSAYKPYAYINDSGNLRDVMPVIWPTFCTCGCCRSGCCCGNK